MKRRSWILPVLAVLIFFQGAAAPVLAARFRDILGAAGVLYALDRLTRDPHQGTVVVGEGDSQVIWYDEYGQPRYDYYYYYVPITRPYYVYPSSYYGLSVYWPWYWRYPHRRNAYYSYPRYYRPYWYHQNRSRYYRPASTGRRGWVHTPRTRVVPYRANRYSPPRRVSQRVSTRSTRRVHTMPGRVHPTPGRVHPTPGRVHPTPGRVHPTPGRVHPTPGRVRSTPPARRKGVPARSRREKSGEDRGSVTAPEHRQDRYSPPRGSGRSGRDGGWKSDGGRGRGHGRR